MDWIILLLVGLILWIFFSLRAGKLTFWKLVGRHPNEAYQYFKNNPDVWKVIDSEDSKFIEDFLRTNANYKKEWVGPYRLYVPSLERVIQIFGKSDVYEKEQEKLILLLKDKKSL